jgi:glyceraldehyde 3-phosphate dehydrogenase
MPQANAKLRVAINGFGRMGRLVLRAAWGVPELDIVHINEIDGDGGLCAHLLEFDSVHGRWPHAIAGESDGVIVDGKRLSLSRAAAPGEVDWKALGVDLVLECTGAFRSEKTLQPYFDRGVRKVIVAAPVKEANALNIVYGVNHRAYDPAVHHLLTAASCTTNCFAPRVKVIHEGIGIRHGVLTTIHDATNTQVVVDKMHKDPRRARSALNSLIPTTTGSATAVALIFPELKGRLNGVAVRVPLLNGSLTDAVFEVQRPTTVEEVNRLFEQAATGELAGILGYEERPLVSADFTNDTRSAIVDAPSTLVVNGTQVKVLAWYDNEIGYVNRMTDLARYIAQRMVA